MKELRSATSFQGSPTATRTRRRPRGPGRSRLGAGAVLASVAVLSILIGGSLSCAPKKTTGAGQETTQDEGSMHGNVDYYVSAEKQKRWTYDALPTPQPSSKPNYLLKSFVFEEGSTSLNTEARGVLGSLAEDLQARPQIRVLVIGMCDAHAENVNAQNLGMNRAQSARQVLLDKGISRDRVETASFGSSQAEAPANEAIGQSMERRVEVWLLSE